MSLPPAVTRFGHAEAQGEARAPGLGSAVGYLKGSAFSQAPDCVPRPRVLASHDAMGFTHGLDLVRGRSKVKPAVKESPCHRPAEACLQSR